MHKKGPFARFRPGAKLPERPLPGGHPRTNRSRRSSPSSVNQRCARGKVDATSFDLNRDRVSCIENELPYVGQLNVGDSGQPPTEFV